MCATRKDVSPVLQSRYATRRIQSANPGISLDEANGAAWLEGKRLLDRAIEERSDFAFETTLGGNTIAGLLEEALAKGMDVRVWYTGLATPELHIARVRSRVAKGGHDIPEAKIRERYDNGRLDVVRLLSKLTELKVFDNSEEADPDAGAAPLPTLLLHLDRGSVVSCCDLQTAPDWVKPILAAALRRK